MRLAARIALFASLVAGWTYAPDAQAAPTELSDDHGPALVRARPAVHHRVKCILFVPPQPALAPPDSAEAPLTISQSPAAILSPHALPFSARAPPLV